MSVKAPLGPKQEQWIQRIRAAGGLVELDHDRRGNFSAWIPVIGGPPIRLPMRMFESLLERDFFDLLNDGGTYKTWKLIDAEERESSG